MEIVVAETAVVILGKHMKFFDRKEEIATLRNPTFFPLTLNRKTQKQL